MFKSIYKYAKSIDYGIFVIDGFGALISSFLLGVVLVKFEYIFGVPRHVLYLLAVIPLFFALFDFLAYNKCLFPYQRSLRMIAIMNILYCCLSLVMAIVHLDSIKTLGYVYIIVEIFIVLYLSIIELKLSIEPDITI